MKNKSNSNPHPETWLKVWEDQVISTRYGIYLRKKKRKIYKSKITMIWVLVRMRMLLKLMVLWGNRGEIHLVVKVKQTGCWTTMKLMTWCTLRARFSKRDNHKVNSKESVIKSKERIREAKHLAKKIINLTRKHRKSVHQMLGQKMFLLS